MEMRKLSDLTFNELNGKYVLLREDFNVQIVGRKITDAFRIDAAKPTLKFLVDNGAKVVICAHLGRPSGEYVKDLSLDIIADYMKIPFVKDCLEKDFLTDMKNGDVVLMENLRFYIGEEKNEDEFAKKLAEGFDLYVNDAFAVSHRSAASIVGITKYLPSYAGILLDKEITNLDAVLHNPERPLVAYVGGGKVSTKIDVLKKISSIADKMVIGGAMGTTFNYALKLPVGDSLCEKTMARTAIMIMLEATENECDLYLPLDKGVGKEFNKDAERENRDVKDIRDDDIIMDDGTKTIERNIELLKTAKTIIWNGPFGVTEFGEKWGKSSYEFARALAEYTKSGKVNSIVGGGDTVAVLNACGVLDDISYVSTGGGAFLEFIEGKKLPGIIALEDNFKNFSI
ncbi:MAG: phosphoglycerate kinase [Alphaproteobacteria bacterium]|nr:phosphoglycerate kinase [Alphaproteobacteria bacterium]